MEHNISYETTDHLDNAFRLLDVTSYGRLDQDDLVFALRIMHLEPSHADLEALMDVDEGLIDRCTWVTALTNQKVIVGMRNHADEDGNHLSQEELADLSEENMARLM